MGGGLMQLVAYGAQDIYLTGNPQITFFKVVYRRHTNFSMEAIQQTWNGSVTTGSSTLTATISRNGDLVSNLWLDGTITSATSTYGSGTWVNWTNNTGHAFVKQCEIEIGGQLIDKHYSQWLDVWNELSDHDEHEWIGLNKHAAKNAYLESQNVLTATNPPQIQIYVPLQFWFCRNPGLALPLIALQYHEVKVKLTTNTLESLLNTDDDAVSGANGGTMAGVKLWADYIYLDTDERRRFAQVSHEYLIEQVQRETGTMAATGGTHSQKLNFNHPVKELIWVSQVTRAATAPSSSTAPVTDVIANTTATTAASWEFNDWFNYGVPSNSTDSEGIYGVTQNEHFATGKLILNGHDRFAKRNASYFRLCQPLQAGHKVPSKHIYCYSFALKPEEHQPSGTCNFSRIDNAKLELVFTNATTAKNLTVYAVNYNVLRIMSGMGGLAYSN
jgi:hypothetical protein